MKKLLAGLFLLGSMLAFAAGEQRVPIEKMELNQQTSLVYVQGQQTPFTGTVEKKYASGKLEATMEFKDGKLNGKYIIYENNGRKSTETIYKDGKENGYYYLYNSNGTYRTKGAYSMGKPVGEWEYYDKDGKLKDKAIVN